MENPQMTFLDGVASLFQSPVALGILLIFTLAFAATVMLSTKKNARRFCAGMVPFLKQRDETGNPVRRTTGQWIGMGILLGIIVLLLLL